MVQTESTYCLEIVHSIELVFMKRRPQTPLNKIPINRYSKYYDSGLVTRIRYSSRGIPEYFLKDQICHLILLQGVLLEKVILIDVLKPVIILPVLYRLKIH